VAVLIVNQFLPTAAVTHAEEVFNVVKILCCLTRESGRTYLLSYFCIARYGQKKTHPVSQMSLNMVYTGVMPANFYSDLSFPAVSGIGVGTFIQLSKKYGLPRLHRAKFPLPFLISMLKNWCKYMGTGFRFPKNDPAIDC
jgi:hypothetical protein